MTFEGLFYATGSLRAAKEPQVTVVQKDSRSKDAPSDLHRGFKKALSLAVL